MSLNIKSQEAERLARELSMATGESMTRAITVALRERLDRWQSRDEHEIDRRADRIREISEDAAGRWVEPYATADHGELLYDERGLPR